MKRLIILISTSLALAGVSAQDDGIADIVASIAEELLNNDPDSDMAAFYTERLFELAEKPVRINSADENEISRLFFLTDFQVRVLADHVVTTGSILSKFEITSIPGFDRDLVEIISPFISLDTNESNNPVSKKPGGNLLSNYSLAGKHVGLDYPGPPWKALCRLNISAGRFTGGLTMEKDAGEKVLTGKPPVPDFLSANLCWNGQGTIRKIIVGDFTARSGTGIGLNNGLRTGLSLTQPGYISGADEIKPYTSSTEHGFFRGAALTLKAGKTSVSAFCSANLIDATLDSVQGSALRYVRTIQKTGLHNTKSSIAAKDALAEFSYGLNLGHDLKNIRAGFLFTGNRFSLPIMTTKADLEKIHDFQGNSNWNTSVYYKAVYRNIIFFGEVSADSRFKKGIVQGLSFRPDGRLTINILYRNYDPGFTSFHGKGILSSSSGDNIRGLFGNFIFEAAKHLFVSAGCDLKHYPWLSFRCSSPSIAIGKELRVKYLPLSYLSFEGVYTYRSNFYDMKESTGIKNQQQIITNSFKAVAKYSPVENLALATRLDYKISASDTYAKGTMLTQDISYKFTNPALSIWIRYCIFNTDNWDTRIYTYENDLVYSFSIPAYHGSGNRMYLMIDWEIVKRFNLRMKYGFTDSYKIPDPQNNPDETSELKIQLRLKF